MHEFTINLVKVFIKIFLFKNKCKFKAANNCFKKIIFKNKQSDLKLFVL